MCGVSIIPPLYLIKHLMLKHLDKHSCNNNLTLNIKRIHDKVKDNYCKECEATNLPEPYLTIHKRFKHLIKY